MLVLWTEAIFLQVDRDPLSDKQPVRTVRDQFNLHYIPLPLSGFFLALPGGWSWSVFEWKCEISNRDLYSKVISGRVGEW